MLKRLLLCLCLAVTPAAAQDDGGLNILQLVAAGDYSGARAALAARPHGTIDRLFLEAQIRTHRKIYSDAITIYRALLQAQPGNILVRQALADVLFQNEEYDAARFHFQELRRVDTRPVAQAVYANALRMIQEKKNYGFSASVTLTPSTNINGGTRNQTVEVNDNVTLNAGELSVEESGIGLQVIFGGFYRIPVDEAFLTFRLSAAQTVYSNDIFNVLVPSASVTYSLGTGRQRLSLSASLSQTILNEEEDPGITDRTDSVARSFALSLSEPLTPRTTLFGSLRFTALEYDDAPTSTGQGVFLESGVNFALSPTVTLVGALRHGIYDAEENFASYSIPGLRAGVGVSFKGGWQTYFEGQYELQRYSERLLFQDSLRKDREFALRANIVNSRINYAGFAPRVSCTWRKTASTIDIYDAETTECALNFTRGF